MEKVLIYGAYGYTGRLIVEKFKERGISPIVAGRDKIKTQLLADEFQLESYAFDLDNTAKLHEFLGMGKVVIHCAGPFTHTANQMVKACLETGTHYLDITGEYQVFDLIQSYGETAKEKGIMLMPGAGFDVVPSDCLAAHLKAQMPDATDLQLAFVTKGGKLSRGTTKTMIESLGEKQTYRKNGEYAYAPMGQLTRLVDYIEFSQVSMAISWGDISTAYFSTGISNIKVYAGTPASQIRKVQQISKLGFILRMRWVKKLLMKQVDKKEAGPSAEKRRDARTFLWGQVTNGKETIEARLQTPNGYSLTADCAATIAMKVMSDNFKAGYQTPSSAYGKDLILEMEGCGLY